MNIDKEREAFEYLWLQANGHFRYFKFSQDHGKYVPTGVQDNLTDHDLLSASITLNTAYMFFLGGIKTAAKASAVPDCTWTMNEDGFYDTSCHESFVFNEPSKPSEHDFKYCCFCGGKLIEAAQEQKL